MSQNRRKFFVGLFGALLALAGLVSFSSSLAIAKDPAPRLEGRLTGINVPGRRVAVRLQNGTSRTLLIPAAAKVERNGIEVSLSAFKIGDAVQARFTVNGATVTKFEGVGR